MKAVITLLLAAILTFGTAYGSDTESRFHSQNDNHQYRIHNSFDRCSFDVDDGTVELTFRGQNRFRIEITEDHELYINGDRIETNDRQKEMLGEYYDLSMELVDQAKDLGMKGAKIGLKGAKIGLGALVNLVKLLDEDYDMDDYEAEIESKAEALEIEADELEDHAELIEDMADQLEDMYEDLEEEITELGELEWY